MSQSDSWLVNNWLAIGAFLLVAIIVVSAILNFWVSDAVERGNLIDKVK